MNRMWVLFDAYAKRKIFFHPASEQKLYDFGMIFGLMIGLGMKMYGYFFDFDHLEMMGATILSLGYISLFGNFYSKKPHSRLLTLFEYVGKLSLTNYIMQTVICTSIFYGYGLGLFGKLGVLNATFLGIFIYCLQILFSCLYIKHFLYGPLEIMMRTGTYLPFIGKYKKVRNATAYKSG